jgi:hypothetical protein
MTTATAQTTRTADLLLVRLLAPAKKPTPPSRLREDLGRLLPYPIDAGAWDGLVEELVAARLIEKKPLKLTDEGRKRALDLLGLTDLPAKADWRTIRDSLLVPAALGIPSGAAQARERVKKQEGLGAWLIRQRYGLASGAGHTVSAVLEALACKELGYPGETSLSAVCDLILSKLVESPVPLTKDQLGRQLVQAAAGTRSADLSSLRTAAIRAWLDGNKKGPSQTAGQSPTSAEPGEPFDLAAFAATALAAARNSPTGRFGDNKVFISHVWRQLEGEPHLPIRSLAEFKQRLVEANHAGLLRLSRADLVQAMGPEDVQASQTDYLSAQFHFVLLEEVRP